MVAPNKGTDFEFVIEYLDRAELKEPVLIEGLPGVGNVGKLAVEHLIDVLALKPYARLYSRHLPPQVSVSEDGVVDLARHDLYYMKGHDGGSDLLVLTGDYQGLTPEGQYILSLRTLELARDLSVSMIFTLGGFGLIRMVETPSVLGAVTHEDMIPAFKDLGVIFRRGEPGSGIIGASGLLLGMGKYFGIPGICLMGETSGYFADPRSAGEILQILAGYFDLEIDLTKLEERAKQVDEITNKLKKDIEASEQEERDDLRYFG